MGLEKEAEDCSQRGQLSGLSKKKKSPSKAKESHRGAIFDSLSNDWEEQVEIRLHWILSFNMLQRKSPKTVNHTSQGISNQKS